MFVFISRIHCCVSSDRHALRASADKLKARTRQGLLHIFFDIYSYFCDYPISCSKSSSAIRSFLLRRVSAAWCVYQLEISFISIHNVQAWQFLDSHNVSLNIRRQVNDFFIGMPIQLIL
jgi:hypothetical protein